MLTPIDSPPIGSENTIINETQAKYKPLPKIEKAMAKIKATKRDTPTVVFLDNQADITTKNTPEQIKEIELIQLEQERIRLEQANIITIVPAHTDSSNQLDQHNKYTTQEQTFTQQDTAQIQDTAQPQLKTQQEPLHQQDTTQRQDNMESKDKSSPTTATISQSLRSSTTSQEYNPSPRVANQRRHFRLEFRGH